VNRRQFLGHAFAFSAACLASLFGVMLAGCSRESNQQSSPIQSPYQTAPIGADDDHVLNVYNWSDFIDPSVIGAFEKEFGIKVHYDVYVSNETMEAKLLAGHSHYDIAVPSGAFFEREVGAGVYQKLDAALLPNLKNLDAGAARATAVYDPGNRYGVDYMWLVTTGVGYDVDKITSRLPGAPLDSWRLVFDPKVVANFKDCGVSLLDSPEDVLAASLAFLGKDPNSESTEDLRAVESVWMSIRPYVRYFDSGQYFKDLANGDLCLAVGWSGDIAQARLRANEAGRKVQIGYSLPIEGSISIVDVLAIPADAPHPRNAHIFINYLLRPDVAAKNAAAVTYASGVEGSVALLSAALRNDPAVYPPLQLRGRLVAARAKSPEFTRAMLRTWTRFKTGE
jgi:putrescine transport system substrate-binding protein